MKLIKSTNVLSDKKQKRITIPDALVEIFDISTKDKFNWYVERKGKYIRLVAMLNKENYKLNYVERKSTLKVRKR